MKIIDIARVIHDDLDNPSSPSLVAVSTWLRDHIGDLNRALRQCYTINSDTLESDPEIGDNEAAIFYKMYYCYYYEKLVRENLGAAAVGVIEVMEGGHLVRKVNRNEVAKQYVAISKECKKDLDQSIKDYRLGKVRPLQVAGKDTSSVVVIGCVSKFRESD